MNDIDDSPYSTHEQVVFLLPWYANNTLQAQELHAVTQHLKVCLLCKRELSNLRLLANAVQQLPNVEVAAPALGFAELKRRLQTPNAQQAPDVTEPLPLLQAKKHRVFGKWSAPQVLALAASVALALVLPRILPWESSWESTYRTLSDAEVKPSAAHSLRIIFKADTSAEMLKSLLANTQASKVLGPDTQAMYTLEFNDDIAQSVILEKLAALRQNEQVVFAEPNYGLVSQSTMLAQ